MSVVMQQKVWARIGLCDITARLRIKFLDK